MNTIVLTLTCIDCAKQTEVLPGRDFWCSRTLYRNGEGPRHGYDGEFCDEIHMLHAPKGWSVQGGSAHVRCKECGIRHSEMLSQQAAARRAQEEAQRAAHAQGVAGKKKSQLEELKAIAEAITCDRWGSAKQRLKALIAAMETPKCPKTSDSPSA